MYPTLLDVECSRSLVCKPKPQTCKRKPDCSEFGIETSAVCPVIVLVGGVAEVGCFSTSVFKIENYREEFRIDRNLGERLGRGVVDYRYSYVDTEIQLVIEVESHIHKDVILCTCCSAGGFLNQFTRHIVGAEVGKHLRASDIVRIPIGIDQSDFISHSYIPIVVVLGIVVEGVCSYIILWDTVCSTCHLRKLGCAVIDAAAV